MDLPIIIVIACVFLASLISLLFIHKFFRGKTFEEVAAEKRLLAEKLYGTKSKRTGSNPKRLNANNQATSKSHKRKNSNTKSSSSSSSSAASTAVKSEPVAEKDDSDADSLSTVEDFPQKEVVQEVVKRPVKQEVVEVVKPQKPQQQPKEQRKTKQPKKENTSPVIKEVIEKIEIAAVENVPVQQSKETKQADEKQSAAKRVESPKVVQNKQAKLKKKPDVNATPPDAQKKDMMILTVNSVMSILSRAEFTRGEIQILIDYLLNKQQDTTANHSEWSDDIVLKLRKKLEEKEKAIEEEQSASAGMQAKLRELRTTINTERVQHNASVKAHMDEIQALKSEIHNTAQDMSDRMERLKEQYNMLKMQNEHFNPQLLLAQINYLNQFKDDAKRNAFVKQIVDILEPQNDELNQLMNENMTLRNEIVHLKNQNKTLMLNLNENENKLMCVKELEEEKANIQLQVSNLQAALDSSTSELRLLQANSQNHVHSLSSQVEDLNRQIAGLQNTCAGQASEANELRDVLNKYKTMVQEKDEKLGEYEASIANLANKEDMLMKELQEQKDKNNDLRKKNWKLVEALQKAETNAVSKSFKSVVQPVTNSSSHEDRLRELLQRLFPDAVASSAGSALSLSFDQWVEQVISTHINEIVKRHQSDINKRSEQQLKQMQHQLQQLQQQQQQVEVNNVSKSTSEHFNKTSNHKESINNHKEESSNNNGSSEDLVVENAQLRARVAELTNVVIITENTLKNLELQAQEQESKWRNVVKLKEEEIDELKNSDRQAV